MSNKDAFLPNADLATSLSSWYTDSNSEREVIFMSYIEAKEAYKALGIDTEAAIEKLQKVAISMHCWQ